MELVKDEKTKQREIQRNNRGVNKWAAWERGDKGKMTNLGVSEKQSISMSLILQANGFFLLIINNNNNLRA